ncbi:hypothetical protein SFB10_3956 [Serratia liquefaciens]|nr:hypothetical protein [Escherichia coli]CAB1225333.1 hypothetical protein SFB10_3956 [Serratia liquefaciens]
MALYEYAMWLQRKECNGFLIEEKVYTADQHFKLAMVVRNLKRFGQNIGYRAVWNVTSIRDNIRRLLLVFSATYAGVAQLPMVFHSMPAN